MLKTEIVINVYDLIQKRALCEADDGYTLYLEIKKALDVESNDPAKHLQIILNFERIHILSSTFIHESFGKLYLEYPPEKIKRIQFEEINDGVREYLFCELHALLDKHRRECEQELNNRFRFGM